MWSFPPGLQLHGRRSPNQWSVCVWCSPPEELVLPKQFPRVRIPFLAALLSPIAWQVGRPDLFDSYSVGVLLLQLAGQLLLHV